MIAHRDAMADPGTAIEGKRQFLALYRSFLFRVVDLELLSAKGDVRNLLGQFAALLAAYSFVLALFTVSHFALSTAAHSKLAIGAWGLEEFYFSTTIAVVGLFAVLAWDALSPDRRDGFVLDPLPVRPGTILGAKYAAILTGLGVSIVAVNVFTGFSFPFAIASGGFAGLVRCFIAYWMTLGASGAFGFGFICAVQNTAATLLSYRLFQRISSLLQLAALFSILTLFFLTPPLATPSQLIAPANQHWLAVLPSYWFLGLFQVLSGAHDEIFNPLAWRAFWGLVAVCLGGSMTAAMSYGRNMRRAIEQPDIAPGAARGALSRVVAAVTIRILKDPIDRAILLFAARTLARSRQHRLVLAVYLGIALAISLAYAKSLVYGGSGQAWTRPGEPLLIAGLVTLILGLIGTRAVFALPFALRANWIFQITAVRSPAAYFSAVRKTLFIVAAVPLLSVAAIAYLSIWPNRPALEHLLVLLVLAVWLVQALLRRFRKIPFACSYLPGKSNLKLKLGIVGVLFLVAVDLGASIEYWAMEKTARYVIVVALLSACMVWASRRTADFAAASHNSMQFEDVPTADIFALDLRRDAEYVQSSDYLDAVSSLARRSLASRVRRMVLGCVLLVAAGFTYERFGEWRDHRRFPQIGHSIGIGERSLNLFCSGSGSPAVIMDSGGGMPGYSWKLVQPAVAKVMRACWYDRAGYGWSDPASQSRTARDVALDLHKLLHTAGIAPPYVLVGHSVGGFNVRVFAADYRAEVAGMVLVDSADEYEDRARLPRSMQSSVSDYVPRVLMPTVVAATRLGVHAGLARLFDKGVAGPDGFLPLHDTLEIHALQLQAKAFDAVLYEGLSRPETLRQVKAVRSLGSLPMIVLSGAKKPAVDLASAAEMDQLVGFMAWRVHVTQARLARLSKQGRQIVLPDVGHSIPTEAPQVVVDAVREVIRETQ